MDYAGIISGINIIIMPKSIKTGYEANCQHIIRAIYVVTCTDVDVSFCDMSSLIYKSNYTNHA